jgi:hypothetical protein
MKCPADTSTPLTVDPDYIILHPLYNAQLHCMQVWSSPLIVGGAVEKFFQTLWRAPESPPVVLG